MIILSKIYKKAIKSYIVRFKKVYVDNLNVNTMQEIERIDNNGLRGIGMYLNGIYGFPIKENQRPGRLVILDKEPERVYRYNGKVEHDDVFRMSGDIWERYLPYNNIWEVVDFENLPSFKIQLEKVYARRKI